MIIDYAPVEFSKRQVRLWLPDSTTVFLAYRGHHYERSHKFTQFQLFLADAVQSVQAPVKQKNRKWTGKQVRLFRNNVCKNSNRP
jgi:hypothetical protein